MGEHQNTLSTKTLIVLAVGALVLIAGCNEVVVALVSRTG